MEKVSPLAYRLRMPASYRMHPALPEYEVEEIIGERMKRTAGKRATREYRVRFKGYGPSDDQWLDRHDLKNAPEILANWKLGKGARELAADD
ncbi:hypothetical protein SCHPADRAFT_840030 [Schizopora paradoxa]|uniref:Chromo domain-containing protein n=1 Tax=Schizopora paradoxa TaxID=27342 RepID=A0A0H2R5Y8_9AGAM|nr:hypothetical protein SCHPADRAFT_840030 [Schizopora paradoxa]